MRKKIVAVLLTGTLIMSMIGCEASNNSEQNQNKSDGETKTQQSYVRDEDDDGFKPLKEKVTISIGKSENSSDSYENGDTSGDNYVLRWFEEQLNIDYEYAWTAVGSDAYNQKSALVISTGDLPDVMTVTEPQMRQLVKAGLVADLTDAYNTYASEQLKEAYATTNGIALDSATFDGKLMAMPNINPGADGIPLLYVRGDWMEELGIEDPKTLDDICNIVKLFQEKKGSLGLVASKSIVSVGNNMYGLDALFALYNSYPEMWVTDDNGNVMYGSIKPETKTALENIAKLVADGIIDRDFAVKDSDQCNELVTSGKGGIFFGSWWNLQWPLSDMWKTDDSVKWNIYAVPLDDNGIYNVHMMNPSTTYLVVRKDYQNLEAVIKTLNMQRRVDSGDLEITKPKEDSYSSWTMFPFAVLMTTYDDKEKIAIGVNSVIDGEASYDDLTKGLQSMYDSWEYVQENGIQQAAQQTQANGYCWYRGLMLLCRLKII